MAIYLMECSHCGNEYDLEMAMADRGYGKPYPATPCCKAEALRRYTPQADPNGESGFKPFYSDALSEDEIPVYVKTRKHHLDLMKEHDVMPMESGMTPRDKIKDRTRWKTSRMEAALEKESREMYRLGQNPELRPRMEKESGKIVYVDRQNRRIGYA